MKIDLNGNMDFIATLKEESESIGIALDECALLKFKKYKDLLLEWNQKMNLTAITDEYQILMKHFIDCLEITKYIKKGEKVIDVGTGAGFPGIVIAIFFNSNVEITLLDSLNKRLLFLEEVIKKLDLKNVKIVHGRAEEVARNAEYREQYDVVVSRAVANLHVLLEYDIGYAKINGRLLLMKSGNVEEEIKLATKAMSVLKCKVVKKYEYKYVVNKEEYTRCILEIMKKEKTLEKYPRNYGQITKKPLL